MTAVRTVRSPCGIGTNMTTTNTITVEMRIKVIDLILDYMPTAYSSGSVGENSKTNMKNTNTVSVWPKQCVHFVWSKRNIENTNINTNTNTYVNTTD